MRSGMSARLGEAGLGKATTIRQRQQPLYARVREELRRRVHSGEWRPGDMLPSELELAAELTVHQGTVRKALGELATERLLERRQGVGTFVAEHTAQAVLFRFFRLFDSDGRQITPDSFDVSISHGRASADERRRLRLALGASVVRIDRLRTHATSPFIRERIALPRALFPGLEREKSLPNTLYDLYQRRFAITIAHADERVSAAAADAADAAALGVTLGTPLLVIDRIAVAIDGTPVEWRISRCYLDGRHYGIRLA